MPTEPADWVWTTGRIDGMFVTVGDLEVTTSADPLDSRVTITFKARVPDGIDLAEGLLKDLSVLLLHRCPRG